MYKPINTQKGQSFEADFEQGTWTFAMPTGYAVASGFFAVMDWHLYTDLLKAASDVLNEFTYSGQAPEPLIDALNRLSQLVNSEQNVQECDATKADSSK